MFKVIMIIYVVSMGYEGAKTDRIGDVDVIMFENMEQCNFAKRKIDDVTSSWGYGESDARKILGLKKDVQCFEFPASALTKPVEVKIVQGEPQIVIQPAPTEERAHKRWNE